MARNIVQILKAGNQELFYSAFIAWLLDVQGEHGLGEQFARWFFQRIGAQFEGCSIGTEKKLEGGGRADIQLCTESGLEIVVENKTKSIALQEQLKSYARENRVVVLLGLVRENFPAQVRDQAITYAEVLNCLRSANRRVVPLSALLDHFISYLGVILGPFEVFDKFCNGSLSLEEAHAQMPVFADIEVNDNDRRFFQAIYFERLLSAIKSSCPNLVFGEDDYYDPNGNSPKPLATRWIVEKNLRGQAFLEAVVYSPDIPQRLRLCDRWAESYDKAKEKEILPRIELWGLRPNDVFAPGQKGSLMLGCFKNELRSAFDASGLFKRMGSRNFHSRPLEVGDLRYEQMTRIMLEEFSKVWTVSPAKCDALS